MGTFCIESAWEFPSQALRVRVLSSAASHCARACSVHDQVCHWSDPVVSSKFLVWKLDLSFDHSSVRASSVGGTSRPSGTGPDGITWTHGRVTRSACCRSRVPSGLAGTRLPLGNSEYWFVCNSRTACFLLRYRAAQWPLARASHLSPCRTLTRLPTRRKAPNPLFAPVKSIRLLPIAVSFTAPDEFFTSQRTEIPASVGHTGVAAPG